MELNMSIKQTMTLSPQMMQSMEILQMGALELLEHIEEMTQENPVLEVAELNEKQDEFTTLRHKLEWLESNDVQNHSYHRDDTQEEYDPISNYGNTDESEENLYLFLHSQLPGGKLSPQLEALAKLIIDCLNDSGYLDEDLDALTAPLSAPPGLAEKALRLVQSLEPAGVGARDLAECLCLQLERRGEKDSLAERIVKEQLDALSKCRYGYIAKQLDTDPCKVRAACDLIRSLNPRPGTGFSTHENLIYVTPDIIVINVGNHFELVTNDYYFPALSISGYYKSLMKDSADNEVKDYLMGKMRQAKWVIRSIEQRRSTLMSCAQCILELQEPFFHYGPGRLVPMSLADVADRLGIHESTVSRAVKDKYIQCSMGIYPLHHFFSRGLAGGESADSGGESSSPDAAKALLKKLIAGEDKKRPISDQKLTSLMEEAGIMISRRTVAKYRDEMGLPSTTGRKEYE